jgi:hypothetical protein
VVVRLRNTTETPDVYDAVDEDHQPRERAAHYERFGRPFIFTPGDTSGLIATARTMAAAIHSSGWAFLRSTFFPNPGFTTGGQVRRVRSQAEGGTYPEFVENVLFHKHSTVFAGIQVVGSN